MIEGYAGCEKCPLKDCPPVPGSGEVGGVLVLGEAPGANEVLQGKPFVGKSGELLRGTLRGLSAPDGSYYVTNACLCRPVGNETPTLTAINCCNQRLRDEIEKVNPSKILTVGATARLALTPAVKSIAITKIHGLGEMIPFSDDRSIFTVSTFHPAMILRDPDMFRDFASDIAKLLSSDHPIADVSPQVLIARSVSEALAFLHWISSASTISCDLETTGFDFLRDVIYSFGFGVIGESGEGVSIIIPSLVARDRDVSDLILSILTSDRRIVFHNSKFDMQFIQVWFGDPDLWPPVIADTMLMQYAQDERGMGEGSSGRGSHGVKTLGLKDQARLRYDVPDYHFDFKKFLALPGVIALTAQLRGEEVDSESLLLDVDEIDRMYRYQGMDCYITMRLYFDLRRELDEESPRLFPLCENLLFPATRGLASMEYNGFPVDIEYFQALEKEYTELLRVLAGELIPIALKYDPDFKLLTSPTQVRKVWAAMGFFPETGAEREVLMLMLKKTKYPEDVERFIRGVLEYRQKSGLLKTYMTGVLARVGSDGRVRSDFILPGADTGRLSSRDPNLQNIPTLVGIVIRRGYIAPSGWKLLEVDYSQLELRIAAFYSRDEAMIRAYQNGDDIHRLVAASMFKKEPKDVTKLERYMAKYVDFGIIYGRSAASLASGWEMEYVVEQGGTPWTVAEAEKFLREFLDGMPGLRDWIQSMHKSVIAARYVETPTGRRRRFPLISRETKGAAERKAVNTPVQSLASDVCLFNLFSLDRTLPRAEAQVVSTVHDALYFLIREEVVSKWVPFIIRTMSSNTPVPIDIPLDVEAKLGDRWGELKLVTPEQIREMESLHE